MTDVILTAENVRIHAGSATREDAIRRPPTSSWTPVPSTRYFDAMQQREETVSTYMGNELAIPHGTNETKDAILDSALSVVRYDGAVDWGGEPARFVVGIAGNDNEHLEILSQIAIALLRRRRGRRGSSHAGSARRARTPSCRR